MNWTDLWNVICSSNTPILYSQSILKLSTFVDGYHIRKASKQIISAQTDSLLTDTIFSVLMCPVAEHFSPFFLEH